MSPLNNEKPVKIEIDPRSIKSDVSRTPDLQCQMISSEAALFKHNLQQNLRLQGQFQNTQQHLIGWWKNNPIHPFVLIEINHQVGWW